MRRLAPALTSAIVLVALAGPVSAAPSGNGAVFVPVGTYDFVITSDIGCEGFDVLVEDISGTIKEITLPHGGTTIFHTTTRYTRTDTDSSIERSFDSIGQFLVRPDGSLGIKALGDALSWDLEPAAMGLADGVWLIEDGKAFFEYDPDGSLVSATLLRGSTLDVCAALS